MAPDVRKKMVWVRDPECADDQVFMRGAVVSETRDAVTVTIGEDQSSARAWPMEAILPCTTNDHPVKDHCNLDVLNAATLVDNTRQRYMQDDIYTYISQLLIAVNPFKQIEGLYSEKRKELYRGCNWTQEEPHVYAIAEMSYQSMTLHNQSQSLLVSGESGAGKTETNKQLMDFLIWRAGTAGTNVHGSGANAKDLAKRILDTNPVLEALGNAKSIRNNNSSRFGKYVNLKFNKEWKVMGAEVRTFLLEKSRVTNASLARERSYHIFYQVLAGSQLEGLGLPLLQGKVPSDFYYTSLSGTAFVDQIDDINDFKMMDDALFSCGLNAEEKTHLFGVLTGMLYLGNVCFEGEDAITVTAATNSELRQAETLLGISDISELLVEKVVKSPRSANVYHIALDLHAALKQRDALVKHIYQMMFDVIVARLNQKIQTEKDFHRFIGLLDVFGFEVFQHNSFEQLCINYANERLHNFFLMRVFEVEIELYKMQNLQVPVLTYPDNSKVIELLEKSPTGIFPMLDAQCKMPKGSDKNFNGAICKQHATHPHFSSLSASKVKVTKDMSDDEVFVIHHFAGDVVYSSNHFLEKNTDALSAQFEGVLKASANSLIVQMVTGTLPGAKTKGDDIKGTPRGGRQSKPGDTSNRPQQTNRGRAGGSSAQQSGSVSKKFLLGLKQLMREIATTHPFFIRCIKPNQTLIPHDFTNAMVLMQLERSGTIECVKLMQAGFPSRAPYADLQSRFKNALPEFMLGLEPQHFVELLLFACNCQPGEYQLGQDMVFFRANKGGVLQELMMMRKDTVAERIVENAKSAGANTKGATAEFIRLLEEFVQKRREERAVARAAFEGAVLAAVQMNVWVRAGQVAIIERAAAALHVQAIRRGRAARLQVEQKRKALTEKKAAEEAARRAAEEAAALAAAAEQAEAAEKAKAAEAARLAQEAAVKAEAERAAAEAAQKEAEQAALEMHQKQAAAAAKAAEEAEAATATGEADVDAIDGDMDDDETEHDKWFIKVDKPGHRGVMVEMHRYLMCKGVEWGFQYHNFYGDWELSTTQQLCNGRPHYVHNTMYGGHAHLFHTIDPHYHVPRWVIGPAPGNENGWAFCESDAPTPHEVQATWISWDGFEWHSCKSFRYVPKEHEMDGLESDEDDFMDEDDEWNDEGQFGSLSAMLADEDMTDEKPATKVQMSLDEYDAMQTERQRARDEQMGSSAEHASSLAAVAEHGGADAGLAPIGEDENGSEKDQGKGGKKSKGTKKGKTDQQGSERAAKKKGLFKK